MNAKAKPVGSLMSTLKDGSEFLLAKCLKSFEIKKLKVTLVLFGCYGSVEELCVFCRKKKKRENDSPAKQQSMFMRGFLPFSESGCYAT